MEFNPAAERTFGYRRVDVVGRELADLIVPPSLRENHHRGLALNLATGEGPVLDKRIEMPALRADGTDLQGRYVYVNDAAEHAFRTTRTDLYGNTDDDVFPADTAAHYKENDQAALASGTGVQVIETLQHADGILHHSLVNKFPILRSDSKAALVGGMAIDVTDRLRAEQRPPGGRPSQGRVSWRCWPTS